MNGSKGGLPVPPGQDGPSIQELLKQVDLGGMDKQALVKQAFSKYCGDKIRDITERLMGDNLVMGVVRAHRKAPETPLEADDAGMLYTLFIKHRNEAYDARGDVYEVLGIKMNEVGLKHDDLERKESSVFGKDDWRYHVLIGSTPEGSEVLTGLVRILDERDEFERLNPPE